MTGKAKQDFLSVVLDRLTQKAEGRAPGKRFSREFLRPIIKEICGSLSSTFGKAATLEQLQNAEVLPILVHHGHFKRASEVAIQALQASFGSPEALQFVAQSGIVPGLLKQEKFDLALGIATAAFSYSGGAPESLAFIRDQEIFPFLVGAKKYGLAHTLALDLAKKTSDPQALHDLIDESGLPAALKKGKQDDLLAELSTALAARKKALERQHLPDGSICLSV